MYSANLLSVGDSVVLAVPPALLDLLGLGAGTRVIIGIEDGRMIVEPLKYSAYSLKELLARCDESAPADASDREWLDAKPVGNELV